MLQSIVNNKILNREIVYAINKAISDDVPQEIRENHLETNNRNIFAAGDYINENLRRYVVKDGVELLPFKRSAWEGRIIIDRINRVTYTISTHQTLKNIIRKNRNRPHYLQSILYAENSDCESSPKQFSIGDLYLDYVCSSFKEEDLEEDYNKIMQGSISKEDEYTHYIIAYTSERHTIMNIEIILMDNNFTEIDKISLMEYVNPDFASLTEMEYDVTEQQGEKVTEARTVHLKLKPGVKPAIRAMEEEA